jgi:hypothetical protein
MTLAEEEAAMKKYRKERKSYTNKSHVSLMKSMASKGVAALPQKSQLGYFGGIGTRWLDQWRMWNLIVCRKIIPFN